MAANPDSAALRGADGGSWRLAVAAGAGGALTIAVGTVLQATGHELGTPTPPFLVVWEPVAEVGAAPVAALVLLAGAALGPRLLRAPPAAFALGSFALALALRLASAAVRDGPAGWTGVFDPARSFEAKNEYLPALGALRHGPAVFLDRFAEVVPSLPVHAAGHPPGLLLTIDALSLDTPARLAALCLLIGALAAPLTWATGRRVLDDQRARTAALLVAASPAMLVFGATSADAVYATLGMAAAWTLLAAGRAGPAVLAVVSLFAWSLLAVGAWAVVLVGSRDGLWRGLRLAAGCAVALVAGYGALALATGYDHLGALTATEQVYRNGIASIRPYWFWVAGSPVAFAVVLGLPTAAWALRARGPLAVAVGAVVAAAALGGFTRAETERIWLFLVPLACLAAAGTLPPGRLRGVLAALVVQALAIELLFDSVW